MPRTDSLQGTLDLLVLKTLSRRPGLHGYALVAAIHEISRDVLRVEEGSLYPALHRMEEAGWILARWKTKDSGRRAREDELHRRGPQAAEDRGIALAAGDRRHQPRAQDGVACPVGPGSLAHCAATG